MDEIIIELNLTEAIIGRHTKHGWRAYWQYDESSPGKVLGSSRNHNCRYRVFRNGDGAIINQDTFEDLKIEVSNLLESFDYLPV